MNTTAKLRGVRLSAQKGRLVADQLLPHLGAGSDALLIALPHDLVAFCPAEQVGDLAPECENARVAVIDAVGGVQVTADDAGDEADRLLR